MLCLGDFAILFSLVAISQGLSELSRLPVLLGPPSQVAKQSGPYGQRLFPGRVFASQLLSRLTGAKLICSELVAKPTFALFHLINNNDSNDNT